MTADVLVLWGAALGTFVASVMANDQAERLRNGAFGTIAGASLGGIAALFESNKLLVLYGVFGSAIGVGDRRSPRPVIDVARRDDVQCRSKVRRGWA